MNDVELIPEPRIYRSEDEIILVTEKKEAKEGFKVKGRGNLTREKGMITFVN